MKKKTVRKVLKKMRKVSASNVKRGNTESENLVANWPSQWSDEDIDHEAKEVCK